jgi:hypothetical protein
MSLVVELRRLGSFVTMIMRVGGAGRDRPESRSAASDRPDARRPPQTGGLDPVVKVVAENDSGP